MRQPGTTALAVGILALGLGVNTAVLAVAYGVLWRPLPYPDADRLVTVAQVYSENGSESGVRRERFDEWNRRLRTRRVAGHNARERVVRGAGPTRVMQVASVTGDFFEVLGVPAVQGVAPRFANGDSRAVISASLARTLEDESGGSALGRTMTVGDRRYDVAAVMPAGFGFPSADIDVWLREPMAAPAGRMGFLPARGAPAGRRHSRLGPRRRDPGSPARPSTPGRTCIALRSDQWTRRCAASSGPSCACRSPRRSSGWWSRARTRRRFSSDARWSGAGSSPSASPSARAWPGWSGPPVVLAGLVLTLMAGGCGGASAAGAGRRRRPARGRGGDRLARTTRHLRAGLVAGQIALSIVLLTGAGLMGGLEDGGMR